MADTASAALLLFRVVPMSRLDDNREISNLSTGYFKGFDIIGQNVIGHM
jgi:hypothetical protein